MATTLRCPSCQNRFQVQDTGEDFAACPECGVEVDLQPAGGEPAAFAPKAVLFGLAVGVLGAVAWAAIAYFGDLEIGWLAWGIGAGVGAAVRAGHGHGLGLGIAAAAITLCSILGGKVIAADAFIDSMIAEGLSEEFYAEEKQDAADFAVLGSDPADADVAIFIIDHGYYTEASTADGVSEEEVADFLTFAAPNLREVHETQPTFDDWFEGKEEFAREFMAASGGALGAVQASLGGIDLIFALLGVATAFRMVTSAQA